MPGWSPALPGRLTAAKSKIDLRGGRSPRAFVAAGLIAIGLFVRPLAAADTGPWDLPRLQQMPKVEWIDDVDQGSYRLKRLKLEQEPYDGKPTRLFAYLALPKGVKGPVPGIVLVHGGAGRAFLAWAAQWASYGYAAIAIDLNGRDDRYEHMADGGPVMGEATLMTDIAQRPVRDMWPYLGVAAAIRGVSILQAENGVDPKRIGMMGISWGSFTASIAASLDERVAFSILVYGVGVYRSDLDLKATLDRLPEPAHRAWRENFDPMRYLPQMKAPVFWMTGATDSFTVDSWTKSHGLTASSFTLLRLLPRWPHGYQPSWNAAEARVFADAIVLGGQQMAPVGPAKISGGKVTANYSGKTAPVLGDVVFTTDASGRWQDRAWHTQPAKLDKDTATVSADLPAGAGAVWFNVTDARGLITSSPCLFLERAASPPQR
jgi:dienelactone hydrolase